LASPWGSVLFPHLVCPPDGESTWFLFLSMYSVIRKTNSLKFVLGNNKWSSLGGLNSSTDCPGIDIFKNDLFNGGRVWTF
jgi:hypothetical protein